MGRKEKIGLILTIVFSVSLPFLCAEHSLEIPILVLPLWVYWPATATVWFYYGKNLWEVFLVCYGMSNIGVITVYFGTGLTQTVLRKIFWNKINLERRLPKIDPTLKMQNKKEKVINWLYRKGILLILFIFLLPLPWSDSIATVAMKLRGTKYGMWYLIGLNLPHVFLYVFLIQLLGEKLFF